MSFKERSLYPSPQHVDSIVLTRVPQEVGQKMGAIFVPGYGPNSHVSERMTSELRVKLKRRKWWLSDEWRNKGLPAEQVLIGIPQLGFDVYNYAERLTEKELEDFKQLASILSQLKRPVRFNTFLIDDQQTINPNSGDPLNGKGSGVLQVIVIEPNTRKPIPHRVFEVGNFLGTLVHEASHFLVDPASSKDLINKWEEEIGWERIPDEARTPGDFPKTYALNDPDRCITSYGQISSAEDFCDSLVAALFVRDRLDPQRLAFLDRELGTDNVNLNNFGQAVVTKRTKGMIRMPRIDQEFFYTANLGSLFTRRT